MPRFPRIPFIDVGTEASPLDRSFEARQARALERIAQLFGVLVRFLTPKRATSVAIVTTLESLDPLLTYAKEIPMSQFHIGVEGCKATLDFNGAIDGEPTITLVGVGTMTQDPKIVNPSAADPSLVETTVVLHFRNPVGGTPGFAGVTGKAVADDPATPAEEDVIIDFPQVCEWIPPAQAKANAVTITTESEPIV